MVKIKSLDEISRKYKDAIPRVADAYKKGVMSTNNWQERALSGQKLYEEKMQSKEILARRAKKLSKVSNEEWKNRAATKGVRHIASGMSDSVDKHRRNYAPFREALASLELPEKTADPMTNIDNRVKAVVKKLVETKQQLE